MQRLLEHQAVDDGDSDHLVSLDCALNTKPVATAAIMEQPNNVLLQEESMNVEENKMIQYDVDDSSEDQGADDDDGQDDADADEEDGFSDISYRPRNYQGGLSLMDTMLQKIKHLEAAVKLKEREEAQERLSNQTTARTISSQPKHPSPVCKTKLPIARDRERAPKRKLTEGDKIRRAYVRRVNREAAVREDGDSDEESPKKKKKAGNPSDRTASPQNPAPNAMPVIVSIHRPVVSTSLSSLRTPDVLQQRYPPSTYTQMRSYLKAMSPEDIKKFILPPFQTDRSLQPAISGSKSKRTIDINLLDRTGVDTLQSIISEHKNGAFLRSLQSSDEDDYDDSDDEAQPVALL